MHPIVAMGKTHASSMFIATYIDAVIDAQIRYFSLYTTITCSTQSSSGVFNGIGH